MKLPLLLLSIVIMGALGPELKSASPAKDTLIEDAPLKVTLTFTTGVRPESSSISILHRDTTDFITLDVKPTATPEVIEALVPRKLLGGHYLIRWKTMGIDGTVVSGLYSFAVDVPE